jgi:hypothetical protein
MSATKSEITINGHPVPERIWIDFRDEPANRYWRVYTAPNAFANVGYVRSAITPADAEQLAGLREVAVLFAIPYEALLMDTESRKWIAPGVWKAIEDAVTALRHALGTQEGNNRNESR